MYNANQNYFLNSQNLSISNIPVTLPWTFNNFYLHSNVSSLVFEHIVLLFVSIPFETFPPFE